MVVINNNKDTRIKNNQKNGDILVKTVGLETTKDNEELAFNTLENLVTTSNTKIQEIAALEQVAIKISKKNIQKRKTCLIKLLKIKNIPKFLLLMHVFHGVVLLLMITI